MTAAVYDHFTKTVSDYDTVVDHVVMRNRELHAEILACVTLPNDCPIKILDLGVGTGHGAGLVLAKYPQAFLVGIDFSSTMINKGIANLSCFSERVELIEADITQYESRQKFDAVISAVTIHNLLPQEKSELFCKLANWLVPGGLFINGDFYQGETEEIDQRIHASYVSYVRSQLKDDELSAWLRHIEYDDNPAKLSEQFQKLIEVGFEQPAVKWQFENEAVYSCCMPR